MTAYELARLSLAAYGNDKIVSVTIRHRKATSAPALSPNLPPAGHSFFVPNVLRVAGSTPALSRGVGQSFLNAPVQEIQETVTWTRRSTWTNRMGFCAAFFEKGEEQALVYRGTDDLFDGLVDDSSIALGGAPLQTLPALLVAQVGGLKAGGYIAGHSLGGALAVIAAAHSGRPAVTFNAPGVMDGCILVSGTGLASGVEGFLAMVARCVFNQRLRNIRIGGDLVSSWLTTGRQPGRTTTLSAAQCGLDALCRHQMRTVLAQMEPRDEYHAKLSL